MPAAENGFQILNQPPKIHRKEKKNFFECTFIQLVLKQVTSCLIIIFTFQHALIEVQEISICKVQFTTNIFCVAVETSGSLSKNFRDTRAVHA